MAKPKNEARALMNELKDLFLKDGAGLELVEKGFYAKAMQAIHQFGGSVDKNAELLARMKEVVEKLDKEV